MIPSLALNLLQEVTEQVDSMLDGLTCHGVCEQLAHENLRHVHGKFNGFDHSWLEIRPWACASGPLLLDCQTGSPWATLYKESEESC